MSNNQPANPILEMSDFMVVPRAQLEALLNAVSDLSASASDEGCEEPWFVGDHTHLKLADRARQDLLACKSVDQVLRRADGDPENGNDPVLMILPAGMDDAGAIEIMNNAVFSANEATDRGSDGRYFEVLQENLGTHGIAISSGVELLRSVPWDSDELAPDSALRNQAREA